MFDETSFEVFTVDGLDERMKEIVAEIQPAFQQVGTESQKALEKELGCELFLHIAQHRRRSVYPPESTWCAISTSKRGYKRYPHFQIAINEDYLAAWLSFIDQPDEEQAMADALLQQKDLFTTLPEGMVINQDHTRKEILPLTDESLFKSLTRWREVKKGEFQIGRVIAKGNPVMQDPKALTNYLTATHLALVPIYRVASQVQKMKQDQ